MSRRQPQRAAPALLLLILCGCGGQSETWAAASRRPTAPPSVRPETSGNVMPPTARDSGIFRRTADWHPIMTRTWPVLRSEPIRHRILLIGDSEAGGLMYPLNDYCSANGHSLVAVFTWFSATILNFAYAPRLEELIRVHRPTLVIIVVGLNELFLGDLARRRAAAASVRDKLTGIEYLWVGPANFAPDRGINQVFEETVPAGRFFLSKDLVIPRASDDRHPNAQGYRIWMDSIASFMRGNRLYRFPMAPPTGDRRRFTGTLVMANAAKDREY